MRARPAHAAQPACASCRPELQARRDRIPVSVAGEGDVARMLETPALVGGKSIWIPSNVCAVIVLGAFLPPPWPTRLLLQQLLETGRYRRARPSWVPTDIPAFDAYVELMDGEELVGLA